MKEFLPFASTLRRTLTIVTLFLIVVTSVFATSKEDAIAKRKAYLEHRYEGKTIAERIAKDTQRQSSPIKNVRNTSTSITPPIRTATGDVLYGFLMSDETYDYTTGIVSISLDENATTNLLHESDLHFMAGTCVYNEVYIATYSSTTLDPTGLYAKDVDTGEERLVTSYSGSDPFFFDMTFDETTGLIYAVGGGLFDEAMSLYSISPSDGSYTSLFNLEGMAYTLAAGPDGTLYSIDDLGLFYNIYPEGGYSERTGYTGYAPAYLQSMAYNSNDGLIYWALYTEASTSSLVTIDPENVDDSTTILAENLGNNAEIGALYFEPDPESQLVPSAPTDFDVIVGSRGANTATLTWGNPTTAIDGSTLTSLTSIDIYRNGELVNQIEDPTVGKFQTWKDSDVSTGMTTYKVVAVNEYGNGTPAETSVFVGCDAPAQVRNLTLEKADDSTDSYALKLSWLAPIVGKHNGYLDTSSLRYTVIRYPDEKVMAEETTELEFVDETITELAGYSYDVIAINDYGESDALRSNTVIVGPALDIPHTFSFETETDRAMWVVVDANEDGCTWYYNHNWGGDTRYFMCYDYYAFEDADPTANDWFFSAPLRFEAGKQYMLTYEVRLGSTYLSSESFRVVLCDGTSPENEVQEIDNHDGDFDSNFVFEDAAAAFIPETSGEYNLGFQVYSESAYFVHITNIQVKEVSTVDAACTTLRGLDVAVRGEDTRYDAVISNTGATTLTNFTVQVVDDDDNVYGQVNVHDYELDINNYVVVPVTCQITSSALTVPLKGKVILDGDENTENDLSSAIEVEIMHDAEKYDLITVGNQQSTSYVAYLPFNLDEQYSVQQILHTSSRLGFSAANIERMGFYYTCQQGEYAQNIKTKIYMANVGDETSDLSNWIDPNLFTLVYEGEMSLDESNDAYMITFDTPFGYNGNKLCIMTETEGGCEDYYYNWFRSSTTDDRSICSMTWSGSEMTFDASEPGMETYIYPNLTFLLDTEYVSSVVEVKETGYIVSTLADQVVTITGDYDRAVLYSIDGMLLQSCNNTTPVSVGGYSQGIYILKVWGNGTSSTHKIIVKH